MNDTAQKKIYVADDEYNIRELIKSFLKNAGFEVEVFSTGDALYEAFLIAPPDLIVLDIMMPGTDGLMLCTKIRETSGVPIIIVSARDSELDRITGITIGSDDYLVKPFSPIELVARINALFRRMSFDQSAIKSIKEQVEFAGMSILTKTREVQFKGNAVDISPTEYAFLLYLFQHQDRAVSRDELLKNVWQFETQVDTRATDDVVKRLRKKLSKTNVRIEAVWGFGFKLEEAPEHEIEPC
ncbi:response regulator transcription factor [Fusibacter bizertensis]|uniref:Stage 0 sporulation protein A homolog n=1 Tax=Fusibacter bizertensis TaxID=1488331 RepID=A0ABT6NAJ2_9FIRM|nr:response regulator transcription factor [Fusibacter bizertensis]MDH8677438.1 response regulator transcription factor [Fusibacter bizertensis]